MEHCSSFPTRRFHRASDNLLSFLTKSLTYGLSFSLAHPPISVLISVRLVWAELRPTSSLPFSECSHFFGITLQIYDCEATSAAWGEVSMWPVHGNRSPWTHGRTQIGPKWNTRVSLSCVDGRFATGTNRETPRLLCVLSVPPITAFTHLVRLIHATPTIPHVNYLSASASAPAALNKRTDPLAARTLAEKQLPLFDIGEPSRNCELV